MIMIEATTGRFLHLLVGHAGGREAIALLHVGYVCVQGQMVSVNGSALCSRSRRRAARRRGAIMLAMARRRAGGAVCFVSSQSPNPALQPPPGVIMFKNNSRLHCLTVGVERYVCIIFPAHLVFVVSGILCE